MVTFALPPGDNDAVEVRNGTPKSRPPLPFAKRPFGASPAAKRFGTPHPASSRKILTTRDEVPTSSLNNGSVGPGRNIFRASINSDSPPSTSFSPSLPSSTMKKVFAPGATPEPTRTFRESTAQVTPRGVASKAKDKELFKQRIADPDPDLTGEVLTQKVPKEWSNKASIYADQFLAHLCPPGLDEEQRRQFFCILDLRRLKYAADEIFARKDWKLNVINFAKEFEKSRSIVLLRYGLYEFQHVKPSKDVVKRWRREHGLPDPDDEEDEVTPTKPVSAKKRKASDEVTNDVVSHTPVNKRRVAEKVNEDSPVAFATPGAAPPTSKNKRKASEDEESDHHPTKQSKPASGARSMFEKAASKTSASTASPAKSSFSQSKSTSGSLMRSVLNHNARVDAQQTTSAAPASSSNIFGHLSDNSSAKNSEAEASSESDEADSGSDESPEPEQSDEPSAKRPSLPSTTSSFSSAAETRENTPGRSLFDRVTKDDEGQPVRAQAVEEEAATPAKDQTWNPSTTPIKFAPSAPASQSNGNIFGNAASTPSGSLFAPKGTAPTNLFGAKQNKAADKEPSPEKQAEEVSKDDGGESDKENESQSSKQLPEPPKATTAPPVSSTPLFQPKAPSTEPVKETTEAPKPAPNLFGSSAAKPDFSAPTIFGSSSSTKPSFSASNMFGGQTSSSDKNPPSNLFGFGGDSKPAESTSASSTPVMQSSTLFGGKQPEPEKPANSEPAKSAPLFGAPTPSSTSTESKPSTSAGNIFGGNAAGASLKPLFGAPVSSNEAASSPAPTQPAASTPTFSFGATNGADAKPNGPAKPLFGAPKSPPAGSGSGSMFDGSPMKQDANSPVKPAGNAPTSGGSFTFGNASQNPPATNNIFGGSSNTQASNPPSGGFSFGGGSSNTPAGGAINFNFGGGSSGAGASSGINNPFASGNSGSNESKPDSNSGGMFNFGASAAPSGSSPFQFGGDSTPAAPSGGIFASNNNTNSTPSFGGSSTPASGPSFSFGASTSQPQQQQPQQNSTGPVFGNSQSSTAAAFNFQPPPPSTGTNTPFSLGGGSSLATTPAGGTPEPFSKGEGGKNAADEEEGEKHEQINLTDGAEEGEDVLHQVKAKVLKFVKTEETDKAKDKSPWSTQGVGQLRLLQNQETKAVRLLMRAEPRGNIALNRAVLPDVDYESKESKYVKLTTSNEKGDGLETWMVQVKTKEWAKELADALEKHKGSNKK